MPGGPTIQDLRDAADAAKADLETQIGIFNSSLSAWQLSYSNQQEAAASLQLARMNNSGVNDAVDTFLAANLAASSDHADMVAAREDLAAARTAYNSAIMTLTTAELATIQ